MNINTQGTLGQLNSYTNNFYKKKDKNGLIHLFYKKKSEDNIDVGYYITTLQKGKGSKSIDLKINGKIVKVTKESIEDFKSEFGLSDKNEKEFFSEINNKIEGKIKTDELKNSYTAPMNKKIRKALTLKLYNAIESLDFKKIEKYIFKGADLNSRYGIKTIGKLSKAKFYFNKKDWDYDWRSKKVGGGYYLVDPLSRAIDQCGFLNEKDNIIPRFIHANRDKKMKSVYYLMNVGILCHVDENLNMVKIN